MNIAALRRASTIALISIALVSLSGCRLFRSNTGYTDSPESRPIEVPPDLDTPRADPSMHVPAVDASAVSTPVAQAPVTGTPFAVADTVDSTWKRLGIALERIEGVTVADRAQLLSAYGVQFEGEEFLIKVSADGDNSRISAVSASGGEVNSGAAGKLLGLLKQRLG